jgi:hypothetical protein
VDAQADLLSRLASIPAAAWREARQQLQPASAAPAAAPVHQADPRQFLLEIMNDRTVELALRIEAAKALLPYSGR